MATRLGGAAAAALVALLCGLPVAATAGDQRGRLVDLLEGSPSYRVRAQAALSLGRAGGAPAVPALLRALGDGHAAVRAAAAQALGRIGSPAAAAGLARLAGSRGEPEEVRVGARRALAMVREAAPAPPAP